MSARRSGIIIRTPISPPTIATNITRVMLVAIVGGLIGVLMMIPLRRALIVQQHGYLKYPEGTACAEVLKAAASPESRDAAHAHDEVAPPPPHAQASGGQRTTPG